MLIELQAEMRTSFVAIRRDFFPSLRTLCCICYSFKAFFCSIKWNLCLVPSFLVSLNDLELLMRRYHAILFGDQIVRAFFSNNILGESHVVLKLFIETVALRSF